MTPVSRKGRLLDLAGLLLFLTGAGLCVRAWLGFQSVPDYQRSAGGPLWETVQLADGYRRLGWVGTGLIAAGVLVFVAAWWLAGRRSGHDEARTADSATVGGPATGQGRSDTSVGR